MSKFLAALFLLLIVESTIHATVSYALTTGPHQPEYTSYEEPGATDMVNLLTGDFSFSLPVLDVPGPEGGFSVPLTYNAGIGPDQEASWVGLGWTLNVGAITRSIVQYPDDASGEVQSITRKNLDGVRGWTSSTLGLGQIGWNTVQGHYGSLSLLGIINYQYDKNGSSGGLVGINVGSNGVTFDPVQFASAAFTIATFGVGGAAVTAGKIAVETAVSVGVGAAFSFVGGNQTPNSPTDGYWEYSKRTSSGFLGIWEDYWIWLDQTRYEEMLGVLNFDKAQRQLRNDIDISLGVNGFLKPVYQFNKTGNSQGNASDISYFLPNGVSYKDATSPVALGTDNYSVKAPNISGSIKPYRLDIGSVSMPRQMTSDHSRLSLVQHHPHKVPFIYEGSNSNSYFYHVGSETTVTAPTFYYGLTAIAPTFSSGFLSYNLFDNIFENRVRPDLAVTKKVPMANHTEWLTNQEIATTPYGFSSGFMDYFSGVNRSQFRENYTYGPSRFLYSSSNNFIDGKIILTSYNDLANFTEGLPANLTITIYEPETGSNNVYQRTPSVISKFNGGSTEQSYITVDPSSLYSIVAGPKYCEIVITVAGKKSPNSIGGYSITSINGVTYHFALPSYEYSNYTKIEDVNSPKTKYSEIRREEPFANTWLLTGITGSDFIDRGGVNNFPNGVIDENDWGYWVKFNYGKYSDDYQWGIPFFTAGTLTPLTTIDASNTSQTRSDGHKQIYYLNSIETRSHVALFIKDTRSDNRGMNAGLSIKPEDGLSLRLSEIDLITREAYQKLFLPNAQGGYGMPTDTNLSGLNKSWMMSDFFSSNGSNHPDQGNFIIKNALKRVKFKHTYDLCQGTDNSLTTATSNKGKLTLTRVALLGRNDNPNLADEKIMPDYKFEYGNNPSYDANKWDGWGMYASGATADYRTHQASNSNADGAAWSLTRITNPLGSAIDVAYERDDYFSISGNSLPPSETFASSTYCASCSSNNGNSNFYNINNPNLRLSKDDLVSVSGTAYYNCATTGAPLSHPISNALATVLLATTTSVTFASNIGGSYSTCPSSAGVNYNVSFQKIASNKKGGNVRVSSLSLNDQGKQIKTRYLYSNDNGYSSGVVAREPEYIKTQDFDFYNLPGYPYTPVMYSKVTVLAGKLVIDTDYHTKQVYEFKTPSWDMIINSGISDYPITPYRTFFGKYFRTIRNEISDYTSKIGKLVSVKLYDQGNTLISSSDMVYSSQILNRNPATNLIENNCQGIFSEGSLMFDRILEPGTTYDKMARTTILKYPYELVKVTNTKDGFTSETENKVWDFISGQVVEKTDKSPLGLRTTTVTKPAFRVPQYSQMGSKAVNIDNKNMLGHEAANYTYQTDASGNNIGLLSASVQTWKSDWTKYRYFNGSSYVEGVDGSPNVWRKYQNFLYKGTYADLRADGSLNFTPSKEFSFASGATNTGWQKTGEVTRYDHYSTALEGKDLNNIFSSSKKDINANKVFANASNATYHEFAYSGAEDWDASGTGTYLGGEVAKGAGTKVTKTPTGTETHTGQYAVQLGTGGKSFTYKPFSLTNNRVYRVSAWTNSLAGAIYYSLNGGAEQTILPISTMKVGNWYQINAEIPVGIFSFLEVGVKSTSGNVSFDDFRLQPRDGSLTANVYDSVTGAVNFVLDNQNMFTQFEYNNQSQLIKTYSESFLYGVKLVSENKYDYKRFHVNQ